MSATTVAKAPLFNSVMVSLCVARKENLFMSVHEHSGWYLPAGRVDYGESFPTGAIRETQEEAGIPVTLSGVLRIQHSTCYNMHRLRVIFAAAPADSSTPKTEADDETIEAKWLTTKELQEKKLRAPEVIDIFLWAEHGAPVYPLSTIWGQDTPTVNHEKVTCKLGIFVTLLIKNGDKFLAIKNCDDWGAPRAAMPKPMMIYDFASSLLQSFCPTSSLEGFLQLRHFPPTAKGDNATLDAVLLCNASTEVVQGDTKWCTSSEFVACSGMPQHLRDFVSNLSAGKMFVAPLNILTSEFDPYE